MDFSRLYRVDIRAWFVVLLMTLALVVEDVQAEVIKTYSSAINKAGRQRMLSQRIVKAYSMIGLDVQVDSANEQLLTSIELFEQQLSELKRFSKTKKNKVAEKSLANVELLWEPFKTIALNEVSKNGVQELVKRDEALLKAAHQVVLDLQKSANSKLGRIVNISGRQRMLSQRIAKFYMLLAWRVNTETSRKLMQISSEEFSAALDELLISDINTKAINESLDDVKVQWNIFERSFQMREGKYIPLLIAMSSEKMLDKMNKVTGLYDQLGK
ncbi:MAG: type IV pili methyl-accepting chemotaxis transducer N-terminal domain-containing protein [Gammaproteobacteria bacterium]|nr:type IV pili methyl-accepting chemotaxis transducer N-terminal domain-containing protein [Gammaproteobacteria bacterium]MCW9029935.1 type IV pili methyl-accepting chemotaxis transducer N-terminal domain-containing protein [Gammaproteobacteria bacterium]